MSLYLRQSFKTRRPDRGQIADREVKHVLGVGVDGEGAVHCGRFTITIFGTGTDQFKADCHRWGLRATFVQGSGATRSKPDRFYKLAFSVGGPVHLLLKLQLQSYVASVHGRGRFGDAIEEASIPRGMPPTSFDRNGEPSTKRLPPVPTEARRVVRPDLPNTAEPRKIPVDGEERRVFDHPLSEASDFTEPMPAAGRVVVKSGKMMAQVQGGRLATAAEVNHQHAADKFRKAKKWAKMRARKRAKLAQN